MFLCVLVSCKEDNLSMNASWLIKPNDASNTMAAKIHEMKKGKGRILQGSCSHNTFSLLDLPRKKSARTFVGAIAQILPFFE